MNKDFFDENFFVISSENYNKINSRLYGYCIFDNKIFINGYIVPPPNADGTYVNITKDNHTIHIQQDYNGGYGLYLFKNGNFFAISNSFLYLMKYLKRNVTQLSLNIDFAKYFITDELASLSVSETLLEQVTLVPSDHKVEISLDNGQLFIRKNIEEPEKVKLDSAKGVNILDNWYHKWQNILITLQNNNEKIMVDLSGGMDSRATFSIFNSPNVNLNKILVNSATDELHTHKEDYEIASMIAERLNFKLNQRLNMKLSPLSLNSSLNISLLTKLGIHKQMYFRRNYSSERLFYFTGYGGETIRSHWRYSPTGFIKRRTEYDTFITINCRNSIEKIVSRSINDIKERYGESDDITLMKRLYRNTRLRSHFGKNIVENFLGNGFCLNPMMDRELQKIHTDDDTLLCVIYDRYLANINDIKFDRNRKLDNKYLENAKRINKKYPYLRNKEISTSTSIFDKRITRPVLDTKENNARLEMMKIFQSNEIKNTLVDLFGYEVYQKAILNWNRGGFFPDLLACSLFSIAVTKDIESKDIWETYDSPRRIDIFNNELVLRIISFFNLARVDIKNSGNNNNDLIFETSNSKYNITTPAWFNKNGIGYVLESDRLQLDIKLEAVGDGDLILTLKGVDLRDEQGNRFPAWIDFTSCKIDGLEQLTSPLSVHHDKPFYISQQVKNKQKIKLSLQWKPYGYSQEEFISMIEKLYKYLPFKK